MKPSFKLLCKMGFVVALGLAGQMASSAPTHAAARTFGMDDRIGSTQAGKDVTFTLLEQNPFMVDATKLKDIPLRVLFAKEK